MTSEKISAGGNTSSQSGLGGDFAGRSRQPEKLGGFTYPKYPFMAPPEIKSGETRHYPVVVVGGGMVGLTAAIDMARKGVRCVLLDDNDTVSAGSRSIAQARRTMDIWSRLGCSKPMSEKGVSWSRGHTHHGADTILSFEVFAEGGSRFPSFTSLAQYYVEHFLVERAERLYELDLRWLSRVVNLRQNDDYVELDIETPEGTYSVRADWVIAADGANSGVRDALGLGFPGDRLKDRFVIADVLSDADFPFERNFWFDPPFYEGNSVLRVPQADSIWRIDWQIDPEDTSDRALDPEVVDSRLRRIFGDNSFKVEWVSTYTSQHRLMDSFRHGRVFFAGDAAHQFSPFGGGRGGNSGVQDADNIVWKIAAVVHGKADAGILDSYDAERRPIARRNIEDSSKSTAFITPQNAHSQSLHDAVLKLATRVPFGKNYVNTGRFSVWPVLENSPLSVPDGDEFADAGRPGTPSFDCPVLLANGEKGWFNELIGDEFALVIYGDFQVTEKDDVMARLSEIFPTRIVRIAPKGSQPSEGYVVDDGNYFAEQYDARVGTTYMFRPDQHVLARWRSFNAKTVADGLESALGKSEATG